MVMATKHICVGVMAHVDAGKTTLNEALLYTGGQLRRLGRVDHGDAYLDTDQLERERGITIFSKQALLPLGEEKELILMDTPGHADFSAEMERTLQVLECAVLVISGTDGVQGHTRTLWRLMERYHLPVFLFVNKMDLAGKDAALERRFQPVMVSEPSVEDTIAILRGLKERYEVFHGVKIQDGAIIAAATLSNRYITDRFLPDKAIDLIDEACALIRTEIDSMPTELDVIQRKIIQHEIEEAALKKETDRLSQEHLAEIQKELSDMREEFKAKKAQWDNEKEAIGKVQQLRADLESANAELEKVRCSCQVKRD